MKSPKIIFFLILSALSVSLYTCKTEEIILHGEISGIVTDAGTGQPLQAATVKLNPGNETVSTGSDGKYLFKSLTPGSYEIEVSKQNYAESITSAAVTSASTTVIDFELDAIPVLHYSPTDLNFEFDLTSLSFTISKSGTGKVGYLVTPGKNWITINPNVGDVDTETDDISVTVNRTGLTQNIIKEWITVRRTYSQYISLDTISVTLWFHNPIVFNSGLTYGNVTDIEGNVYRIIQIGTQTWMAENLRATKYNDNTSIPLVTDDVKWMGLTTPAYCWYKNEEYYKTDYGALYNWFVVNTGKLCPAGWHVPSLDDLRLIREFLGDNAYFKLKETGTYHWVSPNEGATNESGFTALPSAYRSEEDGGFFEEDSGKCFLMWSSTQYNSGFSYCRQIFQFGGVNNYTNIEPLPNQIGISVRCIKDP